LGNDIIGSHIGVCVSGRADLGQGTQDVFRFPIYKAGRSVGKGWIASSVNSVAIIGSNCEGCCRWIDANDFVLTTGFEKYVAGIDAHDLDGRPAHSAGCWIGVEFDLICSNREFTSIRQRHEALR